MRLTIGPAEFRTRFDVKGTLRSSEGTARVTTPDGDRTLPTTRWTLQAADAFSSPISLALMEITEGGLIIYATAGWAPLINTLLSELHLRSIYTKLIYAHDNGGETAEWASNNPLVRTIPVGDLNRLLVEEATSKGEPIS